MSDFVGFEDNPAQLVGSVFTQIHQDEMVDLPFCHPEISVKTSSFQCIDGQWVGAVLTPWMLSLLIFPGPGEVWESRKVTSKVGVKLAGGDYVFTVGEHDKLGQYLSCSLQSPLSGIRDQQQAEQLLNDVSLMAWALPCQTETIDTSKRRLLSGFTR